MYNPYENSLIDKISRDQKNSRRGGNDEKMKNFQEAYEKAEELINKARIKMDKFVGFYDTKSIEADKDYVAMRQKEFERCNSPREIEMHKHSVIAEAIIHDQIDKNGWLGKLATAIKTSKYDDYKGIDQFVEFEKTETSPTAHLALGVDITFSTDLVDKMESIKDRIRRGDLGKIKYLLTKKYRGELSDVPRAVIGFDMKNLFELKDLWLEEKKGSLERHPVKFMIMDQMKLQLKAFSRYARGVNQSAIAEIFQEVLQIIERINAEELKEYAGDAGGFNFESDRVYRTIKNYCEKLNEQSLRLETKK